MLFAPRNASVIELSLQPNVNRCFGYMAMSLELDYWLVPQMSSSYHGHYTAHEAGVEAVVRVVHRVMQGADLTREEL